MDNIIVTYTEFVAFVRFYAGSLNDIALALVSQFFLDEGFVLDQNYEADVLDSSHMGYLVFTREASDPVDPPEVENVTWVDADAVVPVADPAELAQVIATTAPLVAFVRFYAASDDDISLALAVSFLVSSTYGIAEDYNATVLGSAHQQFLVLTRAVAAPLIFPGIANVTWVDPEAEVV